jgi:hypothetical protein
MEPDQVNRLPVIDHPNLNFTDFSNNQTLVNLNSIIKNYFQDL